MVNTRDEDILDVSTGGQLSRKSSQGDEDKINENEAFEQHKLANDMNDNFGDLERVRVTENKSNELNHAKCILNLAFNKFSWTDNELASFHKTDFSLLCRALAEDYRPDMSV